VGQTEVDYGREKVSQQFRGTIESNPLDALTPMVTIFALYVGYKIITSSAKKRGGGISLGPLLNGIAPGAAAALGYNPAGLTAAQVAAAPTITGTGGQTLPPGTYGPALPANFNTPGNIGFSGPSAGDPGFIGPLPDDGSADIFQNFSFGV
jgi:hypothetical protein